MQLVGFYPFLVSVWNFFPPSTGVKLNVTFNHHRCYSDENNDFKAESSENVSQYSIEPGMSLAFPMYFGDESLVLSIDPAHAPTDDYQLSAGDTAECLENGLGDPVPFSSCGKKEEKDGWYWEGGTWAIANTNKTWQLKIKKFIVDPQSDDVSIGPGTPG